MSNNPIGNPRTTAEISAFITQTEKNWDIYRSSLTTPLTLGDFVDFILDNLGNLCQLVEEIDIASADKKATCLLGITTLWNYAFTTAILLLWLKPFGGIIGGIILNQVIPVMIDWIVKEFQAVWKKVG